MIDSYFWPTPNGYKVLMMLEETGVAHRIIPVNINQGDQFAPEFSKISANNKIPAIVDHHNPGADQKPVKLFESGAILLYLAEKTGKFIPSHLARRANALQWLFWQVGGLGPMLGQNLHFGQHEPAKFRYSIKRYADETKRLFQVLDTQLADQEYVAGEYSIADMASYPWIHTYPQLELDLNHFPNLRRWHRLVESRAAVINAYKKGAEIRRINTIVDDPEKSIDQTSTDDDFKSLQIS